MQCEEIKQSAESPTLGLKFVLLFFWQMSHEKCVCCLPKMPALCMAHPHSRKISPKSCTPRTSYSSVEPKGWWCWSSCTKFPFNVFAQSIKRQTTIEYRKVVKQSWERNSGVSMNITLELQSPPRQRKKTCIDRVIEVYKSVNMKY